MKVPFQDLSFTTSEVETEFLSAVKRILERGPLILGPEVENFEKVWAKYLGVKYAIGVSNGGDALYLSLVACGVKPGDEIITQGNAYNASVTAILRAGAVPRFADISPDTLQFNVSKIEGLITSKTRGLLPVHLYGQSGDMEAISKVAREHELKVIEDCAQAHGAEFAGKKLGTYGQVNAFSFYPTKNLGAFGDAGAVVTDDAAVAEQLRALRNLGQVSKNDHRYFGTNMRLDPLQAAGLALKLRTLDKMNAARRQAGEYYNQLLKNSGSKVRAADLVPGAVSVYHLYVVLLPEGTNREDLQKRLVESEIQTAVHYPVPVYRQPFYKGPQDLCPVVDGVSARILSLPMFYGITREQQEYVIENLAKQI
ncbi:MAG: DegT/DnrJ/EryC1/StrS family aminotransferase [Patescibacteria group bacterium]|nr:DegT/DnrJ/EryC1/StrS family aminotransferase [Patescibacteria group bacterium]